MYLKTGKFLSELQKEKTDVELSSKNADIKGAALAGKKGQGVGEHLLRVQKLFQRQF